MNSGWLATASISRRSVRTPAAFLRQRVGRDRQLRMFSAITVNLWRPSRTASTRWDCKRLHDAIPGVPIFDVPCPEEQHS
jgi:hypothetical protein